MPNYKIVDYTYPTAGELARCILQFKNIPYEDEKLESPDRIYEAEEGIKVKYISTQLELVCYMATPPLPSSALNIKMSLQKTHFVFGNGLKVKILFTKIQNSVLRKMTTGVAIVRS